MLALLQALELQEVPASQLVCTALSEQRWCMHMQYGVGNIWYSMLSLHGCQICVSLLVRTS
jgi:hypothetical protein